MIKPVNDLKPEDALPVLKRWRNFILGIHHPDDFTRWVFFLTIFGWILLAVWNIIGYFVLISAPIIEKNKGFSVDKILIRNGQNLGFNGADFILIIRHYYFYSIFIWLLILIGIVLIYRKSIWYPLFFLGGFAVHFIYMFMQVGFQYFIEDISLFDKTIYGLMIGMGFIHSFFMKQEINTKTSPQMTIKGEESDTLNRKVD